MRRAAGWLLLLGGTMGCAYYNEMWRAQQLAKQARQAEARGGGDAPALWARAAVKAESVVVHHPRSRWVGPALVLQGEGLARSGACERAAAPLARAREVARAVALRERIALALAECALAANAPAAASRQLGEVTRSHDGGRRSRAAFLAGRAAELARDLPTAAEWYGRSAEPGAASARARVLLATTRTALALSLFDTLATRGLPDGDWAPLLEDLARTAGPDTASGALDRLLARRRLPAGTRGRLLLADGDRLLAAGRAPAAGVRYATIASLLPDSVEGQQARVRQLRALGAQADSLEELRALRARLGRLADGVAAGDARAFAALLGRVLDPQDGQEGGEFRTAELVRDSVGAPRLAARLFLGFAAQHPRSLFTPKALVSALALRPEARDSLVSLLDAHYAASPYTLALHGEASPGFAAAEDSLAQTLGLERAPPFASPLVAHVAPPVPGPRGPLLDPPPVAALTAGSAARPASVPRRPAERDDQPVRPPRPAGQPRDSL